VCRNSFHLADCGPPYLEPSSVLASRITRAHDNPSPPPNAPVFDSDSPTPPHPIPFLIPGSPSPHPRGSSPFAPRPPPSPQNTTQPDLITFDSFSTPAGLLPTHPIASTSFVPQKTINPSVDELLTSWSPSAQDIPEVSVSPPPSDADDDNAKGRARASDDSAPEAAEEQAVVNALIFPDAKDSTIPSSFHQGAPTNAGVQALDEDEPRTPLRRSTRPRRSGTPHAHLVPIPSSDEEESPTRTQLTPSSALTKKKRRKGKERDANETSDSQGGETDGGGIIGDALLSEEDWERKRRKERGERKQAMTNGTPHALLQRQLGSLSPGSANLLTQLLPPSRPSPVREQDEPQQPAYSFSVFSVANPAHTTPVRGTSPIRTSPSRNAKPRSPNRMQFQPPSLNDPNRTPARRIPVEQAVARGQISPQKGAQLLSSKNIDAGQISRTPIFHIPSQDSPARRVNAAAPPAGQGTWQAMRLGSPTRGKSRERTGSVEPRAPWNGAATAAGPSDLKASTSKSRSSPSRSISAPIKKGKLPFPLTPSGPDRPAPIPEMDDKILSPKTDTSENPVPPVASPVLSIIKVPRSILKQPTSRIPRIGTKPYARPPAQPASDKGKASAVVTRKVGEAPRLLPVCFPNVYIDFSFLIFWVTTTAENEDG
jgi:hypothetical protein